MRKSQLRLTAERGTNRYDEATLIIYKAMQWRWEDGQTADPQISDVTYHLTESDAIVAADTISLDLGYRAQVDSITFDYSELNEGIEFREEFELADLDYRFNGSAETIYEGATNEGDELDPDAIVIMYRNHRFMNYAYAIEAVKFVWETDLKTQADLRDDSDSLGTIYCTVVADIDELTESFRSGSDAPFNKINSGSSIIREFLEENGHPDFIKEEEEEDESI